MSLRSTLRKAAGLLVELPPEEEESNQEPAHQAESDPADARAQTHTDTTEAFWNGLEKDAKKPQTPETLPQTKTVEQIVRENHGPNLDQIQVPSDVIPADSHLTGTLDFNSIYQAAALPLVPFTAEQALDMFAALPAEVPIETKRQMMKVSINAMGKAIGATPESIVTDASRKLAALASYADHLTATTQEYTSVSEQKIASLEAEIDRIRQAMAAAQQRQAHETQLCLQESDRLDDVLEFFSLDVPPSSYAAQNHPDGPTIADPQTRR